jgi:hypothetical protein
MDNLESAIKIYIENQRGQWIKPDNNPIVNHSSELHIKTIEQAPRDSKSLENLIAKKRIEMKAASKVSVINKISIELQALRRLYGIVQRYERGKPLSGLAY